MRLGGFVSVRACRLAQFSPMSGRSASCRGLSVRRRRPELTVGAQRVHEFKNRLRGRRQPPRLTYFHLPRRVLLID